jgi:hypothetical protein
MTATMKTFPTDDSNYASLRDALLEYFPSHITTPDSAPLLTEVMSILRIYNLTPSDLADKWESFCLNKKHLLAEVDNDSDPFTLENVRELKKHLQESLEREARAKRFTGHVNSPAPRVAKGGMAEDMCFPPIYCINVSFAAISPQTPSVRRKVSGPSTVSPAPKSRFGDTVNTIPILSSPLAPKSTGYSEVDWF